MGSTTLLFSVLIRVEPPPSPLYEVGMVNWEIEQKDGKIEWRKDGMTERTYLNLRPRVGWLVPFAAGQMRDAIQDERL